MIRFQALFQTLLRTLPIKKGDGQVTVVCCIVASVVITVSCAVSCFPCYLEAVVLQLTCHVDTTYIHPLSCECCTGPKRGAACQAGITASGHGEEGGQVKTAPAARCGGHLSAGKEDLTPRSCESLVRASEACYCEAVAPIQFGCVGP